MRSATWEAKATEDGHMTSALYEVYEKLAKNEIGFICTGMTRITEEECANEKMLGIYDDSFIEEYKHLTQMVHDLAQVFRTADNRRHNYYWLQNHCCCDHLRLCSRQIPVLQQ